MITNVGNSQRPALRSGTVIQQHRHSGTNMTPGEYQSLSSSTSSWVLKCTDVPQFDALQAQADLFRTDDKLHLRNLCSDTARCASLLTTHTSRASYRPRQYQPMNTTTTTTSTTTTTISSSSAIMDTSTSSYSNASTTNAAPTNNQPAITITTTPHKMILDYSRQRVTGETMEQLYDLADAVGLAERCWAFKEGAPINITEGGQPVLHHVLRMPSYYRLELSESSASSTVHPHSHHKALDGRAVLQQVHQLRTQVQEYAYRVRSGEIRGATGRELQNTIVVASGGAHVATACVARALRCDPTARAAAGPQRKLRFASNADPVNVHAAMEQLDPAETLIVIVSPTFATTVKEPSPVLLNARTALAWLIQGMEHSNSTTDNNSTNSDKLTKADIMHKHVLAVTQNHPESLQRCHDFGIAPENVYALPEWVQPRYSVCSAVGLLPLSLQYSYPVMSDFLDGAHDMDEHFFHVPLRDNIPVILGLLGVWNSTFLGYNCRCIIPYADALRDFAAYVQHVDMESNGKRVAMDGTPLLHRSGEINFGDPHHALFQLLHQGRVIPTDFIGFMENPQPTEIPGEAVSNHDELMSHFFAQPDALAHGKTLVDLGQEGTPEPLREHLAYSGNRPSTSLLMTRLDAFAMGQLVALFEHRTAVQGFVWGINSFDTFGWELGTASARHVRAQLSASRKTGASVQGFNSSTSTLLEHYLAHGKAPPEKHQEPTKTATTAAAAIAATNQSRGGQEE